MLRPQDRGWGGGQGTGPRRRGGRVWKFSRVSFLISVKKQRGHGLRIREEGPGLQREEPSHVEAEQVDQRGVAALPDSSLADGIFPR